jgi:acetyltransferase-like isoleucine patch superfamily enzyme
VLAIYFILLKKHSRIKLPFRATSVRTLLDYTDSIGSNVYIGKNALIGINRGATFKIGDGTWINEDLEISCNNSVEIGSNVVISRRVYIGDNVHPYEDISKPISVDRVSEGGYVKIEDECWIGTGACILKNVTIGKHSVIGANAVVTKDIPPYSVAVGIPARVIKKYDFEKQNWVKIDI